MSITILIVIVTCLISYLGFQNAQIIEKLKHWPYLEAKSTEYYRLLTGGFMHANWMHLGVNMFVLWSFGSSVEQIFASILGLSPIYYLIFYLLAIIFAGVPSFFKHRENRYFSSIGASGAVSAVTFASILFNPASKIYLYGALPVPAWLFGGVYLAYSSWAGQKQQDNTDHSAHFWGAVFGFFAPLLIDSSLLSQFFKDIF